MDFHTLQHPALNKPPPKYGISDLKKCGPLKRPNVEKNIGLKLRKDPTTKKFYVQEVEEGGMFQRMTSIKVGDQVIKVNGRVLEELDSIFDINKIFKTELEVTVHVFTDAAREKYG